MGTCPVCAAEAPDGARFCAVCGARVDAAVTRGVGAERRIVTTLFCDLVGFTSLAERIDPEDADAVLRGYYALTRHVIEQYGGTVEKFIGDAVAGVFGFPTIHEDDAERAVRAAVRLQERITELPECDGSRLRARIGVNTGPALVRLGVDPASGQGFLVGDSVNIAARLQTLAPAGGVAVGELTHTMAARVAEFSRMPPVQLKGKRALVRPWLVEGGIQRPGLELTRTFASAFVGRQSELRCLGALFDAAVASGASRFALITAEAGMGKSRLVHELGVWLDERPDVLAAWRKGCCQAYGEGLSLLPLAQIVKEQAAIGDDGDGAADAKLRRAVETQPDAEWLAERVRPLLGLPSPAAPRDENFTAWLRFVELIAGNRPAVLVFEDAHWASPVMVEFLGHLVGHVRDLPLLCIITARPEFLRGNPEFVAAIEARRDAARARRIDLGPLSLAETERLVAGVTGGGPHDGVSSVVARRSGGNPLYAEELTRHLMGEASGADETARNGMSAPLQAFIAARLDTLRPDLKELLSSAAVVGETFSAGLLASMGGVSVDEVEPALRILEELAFVRRRLPASSDIALQDYVFWHGLTRDVAYDRLTRADRAARHRTLAELLDDPQGPAGDLTAIVAYHYQAAVTLMAAAGSAGDAERLRRPAVHALRRAADRAMGLDYERARDLYQSAIALLPQDDPSLGSLLNGLGRSLTLTGEPVRAVEVLRVAVDRLQSHDDERATAAAMVDLARALLDAGDAEAFPVFREALSSLDHATPSEELVSVLQAWAGTAIQRGQMQESLEASGRSLEAAATLGLPVPLTALECRAWASCALGRVTEGLADARDLLSLLRERRDAFAPTSPYASIADLFALYGSAGEARAVIEEGLRRARSHHASREMWSLRICQLELLSALGRWDEALAGFTALERELSGTEARLHFVDVRCLNAIVRALRGERRTSRAFLTWLASQESIYFGFTGLDCLAAGLAHAALGETEAAAAQLRRLAADAEISTGISCLWWLPAVRAAMRIGRPALADRVARRALSLPAMPENGRTSLTALSREIGGETREAAGLHRRAADGWRAAGYDYEAGEAELGLARCLAAAGDGRAAREALAAAAAVLKQVGARPALEEARRLRATLTPARARRAAPASPTPASAGPPPAGDTGKHGSAAGGPRRGRTPRRGPTADAPPRDT